MMKLKTFIIIEICQIVLVSTLYLYLIPRIKPLCASDDIFCAATISCRDCNDKTCVCDYIDENGDLKTAVCPKSYRK